MNKFTLVATALMLPAFAFAGKQQVKPLDAPVAKVAASSEIESYTWKDLGEGTFSDFVLSNLFVGIFNEPVKVMVQESEQKPGVYRLVNPWQKNDNVNFNDELNYLVIDASDPDYVMVPAQQSPVADAQEGETWYCSYTDWAVNVVGIDKETFFSLQPDKVPQLRDGVMKFSRNTMAVMYPYGTGAEFEPGTWSYTNMEYEGYLALPGASGEDVEDWVSIGRGRFLEGFLETIFDEDYVPEEREVEIMENKTVAGVYKVVKAFQASAPTGRDLIIDARQPGFVKVEEQNTGVNSTNGWVYILSVSTNGMFSDYESMVTWNPDYASRNITMDEKGIYFPKNSILLYFPQTGNASVYTNPNAVDSYLLFPESDGVGHVSADESDAPVMYFNLQGMRVESPQPGQLVIVRKGSVTYKTIIR